MEVAEVAAAIQQQAWEGPSREQRPRPTVEDYFSDNKEEDEDDEDMDTPPETEDKNSEIDENDKILRAWEALDEVLLDEVEHFGALFGLIVRFVS